MALWNDDDKAGCAKYRCLVDEADEYGAELRALADHPHVSVLKNSKGRLTLKAINSRLAVTRDSTERATLTRYLEVDRQKKAKSKEATKLLAKIEERYRGRLRTDPIPDELEDLHVTIRYLDLLEELSTLNGRIKEADAALDQLAYEKYLELTEPEIKTLVVDDKWMSHLAATVRSELERVSNRLTGRIHELAERYASPLPELAEEVERLAARVEEHLARMGAAWR